MRLPSLKASFHAISLPATLFNFLSSSDLVSLRTLHSGRPNTLIFAEQSRGGFDVLSVGIWGLVERVLTAELILADNWSLIFVAEAIKSQIELNLLETSSATSWMILETLEMRN